MKIQIFYQKFALQSLENVSRIFTLSRKNFSIFNTLWKKTKPDIVRKDCEPKSPILKSSCKVALVIGGSNNGFGYFAAEQMLSFGAKRVIIADYNTENGECAVEKLCRRYGKHRAKFYPCNIKSSCHIEAIFASSYCNDEHISIMLNDLDAIQKLPDSPLKNCDEDSNINNTLRLARIGVQKMCCNKKNGQSANGIIINCASILGFVGWPEKPKPIYYHREPVIETTQKIVTHFPVMKTGIRVVSLCPINRAFETIGLPDFPDSVSKEHNCPDWSCSPDLSRDRSRVGKSIVHLMAYATTGSVWLLEPPFTLREIPKLVDYFKPK